MVHSVDEVDVRDPCLAEHDIRPLRSPFRRMASLILRPDIGLHFDNLPRKDTIIDHPNEILADERSRNRYRWAIEIVTQKDSALCLHMGSLQAAQNGHAARPQATATPQV
jgi:hypothetical protein